jgi:hypothetical protein
MNIRGSTVKQMNASKLHELAFYRLLTHNPVMSALALMTSLGLVNSNPRL